MDFCIDKDYFGTPFYLIYRVDKNLIEKVKEIPPEVESGSLIMIGTIEAWIISKLYGITIPRFPPIKYRRFFSKQFSSFDKQIPWGYVLPEKSFKEEVRRILEKLKNDFGKLDLIYYQDIFKKESPLFFSLKPAKINAELFMDLISSAKSSTSSGKNESTIILGPNFKSFVPTKNGFANIPYYDRVGTKTGRLRIKRGPNILLLKKKYRNILTSRFGSKGSLYQLDYPSLEPRVLLSVNGKKDIPEDIYVDIKEKLNLKSIPREAIKKTVISRLYGSGDEHIEKEIKFLVDYPRDLISLIDEHFGIEETRKKLSLEYFKSPVRRILNHYGRPIPCGDVAPYVLLNYFVQSTAVDVALLGFNQIISKIKKAGLEKQIIPIFILHDALFLDIHKDVEYLLEKLCKAGSVNIPKFEDINFHLKFLKNNQAV